MIIIREFYQRISCKKKFLVLFLYIIFGHLFYSIRNIPTGFWERFRRRNMGDLKICLIIFLILLSYFWLQIVFLFFMIYYNIIMLIPYLIIGNFSSFIYHSYNITRNSKFSVFFYNFILFILFTFFGGIVMLQYMKNDIMGFVDERRISNLIMEIIYILFAFIYAIIYFPLHFLINIINLLIFVIFNGSIFMNHVNEHNFYCAFGVLFYNLNY